ncbi:hypothetical protein [Streptomyces sp. NPDC058751]|uniref:hypothetical protein n=1 Tax=Streptomyces sp. NPDC058751 TaxID=3346623 RepID=UPI0036A34D04
MGTSLTPEFWGQFAVLLVLAASLAGILTAALESLAVRLLRRRSPKVPEAPHRPIRKDHRASVHC